MYYIFKDVFKVNFTVIVFFLLLKYNKTNKNKSIMHIITINVHYFI